MTNNFLNIIKVIFYNNRQQIPVLNTLMLTINGVYTGDGAV